MFGPGGVLWLLSFELRLSWRSWRAGSRSRGAGSVVLYIFLAVLLGFAGYWAAYGLSLIEPKASPLAVGIICAAFVVLATLMLSQALMLITEALYVRGDLDLLLASPLPTWRVLLVRMAAIALNVAAFYLILLGAMSVWLPFFGGWRWLGFAPSVLALSLAVTGLGLVVARALFVLIGPRATRVAAQIVGGFFGAAIFLAFQSNNFLPREQRIEVAQRTAKALSTFFAHPESPLALPARAALGEPVALALWIGGCAALYGMAVWWFASRFAQNAAAIAGGAGRKRADARVAAIEGGGITRSLVRKEWRLLARDPLLLSQILLQIIYLIPLFLVFARDMGEEGFGRTQIALFAGAFVLLSSSLASSLAWLTVSAEDAPDLIAAAPVARTDMDHAKAIAAGLPVALLMVAPVVGATIIAPMAGFWLALGIGAAIVSSCLVSVWHQAPGSRKNFRRRRARGSVGLALGQGFTLMGWSAATGLAVAGLPLLGLIPALIALGLLLALSESRPKPD